MARTRRLVLGMALTLCLAMARPASAQVVFMLGNNPQSNEENVLLSSGMIGTVVTGTTNQTGLLVQFESTTDTLFLPSNGQARVETSAGVGTGNPNDNPLNNITVSLPGGTFADLIFNPFIGGSGKPADGDATVTVLSSDGTSDFTYTLGNGSNFLTVLAQGTTRIESVTIDSANGFTDLRQVRISGVQGGGGGGGGVPAVPEPGALAMLAGMGLGGLAVLRRRLR